jgi:hypothetical protein
VDGAPDVPPVDSERDFADMLHAGHSDDQRDGGGHLALAPQPPEQLVALGVARSLVLGGDVHTPHRMRPRNRYGRVPDTRVTNPLASWV